MNNTGTHKKAKNKIVELQQKFERLISIDFEGTDEEVQQSKSLFQIQKENRDYNSLGYGLKTEVKNWSASLFAQMSLFFEVGLYIKKTPNQEWNVLYSFSYGQFTKEDRLLNCKIPTTSLDQIFRKTQIEGFENLNCAKWIDQKNFQAFLLPLQNDVAFVAFTGLAEPWLKLHLEKIHQRFMQLEL